ncbi:MAG: hypothetical protein K0R20_2467 [Actinomycetia bacterium]|nr:hypothetical protein [Actinomycetes bacterium]
MIGSLVVGLVLFAVGARAPGAALVGSSIGAFASLFTPFHSGHLETLVHGAVILGSVGLVGFGLVGLASGAHWLGRYPVALALGAIGSVVVGALLILRIYAEAAPTCPPAARFRVLTASSPFAASCFRGFEEPWVRGLLTFNVAFLALLFLVQAWQASRSSGEEDPLANWLLAPFARGGSPF